MRDYTRYRSLYCAVCKSQGRQFGQLPRLSVSYEATFLALFFLSFRENEKEARDEACIANPLVKHPVAAPDPLIDFASLVTAALVYGKGQDDLEDGQWFRALPQLALFRKAAGTLRKEAPELVDEIELALHELRAFERMELSLCPTGRDDVAPEVSKLSEKSQDHSDFTDGGHETQPSKSGWRMPGVDLSEQVRKRAETAAAYSGRVLGAVMSETARHAEMPGEELAKLQGIFQIMGTALGEWIYFADALDDADKDAAKGRFNPFMGLSAEARLALAEQLMREREETLDAHAALLPYFKDAAIVQNVICEGLPRERARLADKTRASLKHEVQV